MINVVSTAFNFDDLFRSGVDPRTGIYSLTFKVGCFLGVGGQALDLMLGYNFTSSDNKGFGKGWSLNLSHYDSKANRLTLAGGSSYKFISALTARDVGDVTSKCQYLKIKYFKVEYSSAGTFTVTYKDGSREIIGGDGHLDYLIDASGRRLSFSYQNKRLQKISDESGRSFNIEYDIKRIVFTNSDKSQVKVHLNGDRQVIRVEFYDYEGVGISYRFYNGLSVIEKVEHATGSWEKISYYEPGHRLQSGGAFPAVSKHEFFGIDFKKIIKYYSYSPRSYLGYFSRSPDGFDALFERGGRYEYSSEEYIGNKIVLRVYNKYHQLQLEQFVDDEYLHGARSIYYPIQDGKRFDEQPVDCMFPKRETTFFSEQVVRKEIVDSEYDEFGNVMSQTDAYGIKKTFSYYAGAGEANCAPVSPLGMPCMLKQSVVFPSERNQTGNEIVQQTTYTYISLPGLGIPSKGTHAARKPVPHAVISSIRTETHPTPTQPSKTLSLITMEYLKDSGPETYGRLSKKTTTQSGTVTTEVYTYTVKGTTLQTVLNRRVSKGNSVISSQTKTTSSLDTGLELETIDELGVITRTTYDTSGRVIEEKYRADTEYEIVKSYKYLAYSGRSGANLKITTSDGTEEEIEYDSLRRERIKYITDPNLNVIKEAQAYHYNALGQVEAVSIFDNLGAGTRELKTFLSYDFWGGVCKEVTPSGATQIVERHKSLNTVTTYLQSTDGIEGKVTHKYNELGLLVTSTYPEFVTGQIYDGLGVLLETVNASGKSTRYTRDEAGRVTKKVFDGNPQIVIEMAFDSQSLGDQVTEIKVNGTVVGKRKYDAIGRVLTETKGAYTTSYEYGTLSSKPTKITRPDGQVINYELNLVLDEVIKYTLPDNKISNYTFHQPTGRLLTASNDNLVVEKDYYSNGTVKSETQHGRTANYRYSLQGLLLSSNDYFGQTETRFYDNVHRLIKVIAGDSTVALEYDSLDRVKTETITSVDGIPAVRHDYRYDAQSRILSKDTLVGGVRRQTERYKFAKNGKLSTISTEDSAGDYDTEGYAYDNLGRLIYCSYGGLTRPAYFHLGPISSQHFKFDLIGNITEVRSKFGSEGDLKSDTATYGYDSNGLCVTIKHSNPGLADVTLEYDENGNVRKDEQGRLHEYNVLGQLIRINAVNNTLLSEYSYGANGIQYKQTVPRQGEIQLFYGATGLMNEMQGDSHSHMLSINGRTLNRVLRQPNKKINVGLVGDYKNSTNIEIDKAGIRHLNYTVFGETP